MRFVLVSEILVIMIELEKVKKKNYFGFFKENEFWEIRLEIGRLVRRLLVI